MSYYIILNPTSRSAQLVEDFNGFVTTFQTYEEAKAEAEDYKLDDDVLNYAIVGRCTDERNHII